MRELKIQRIINASIDLFAEKGIRNVPIERIAEKLGVSKGKVYYYFKNGKSDIVNAILQIFEDLVTKSIPSPKECETQDANATYIT